MSGRSPVDLSSEYVGIRARGEGGYEVWYRGDWGTDKVLVETDDFAEALSGPVRFRPIHWARGLEVRSHPPAEASATKVCY